MYHMPILKTHINYGSHTRSPRLCFYGRATAVSYTMPSAGTHS